MINMLYNKMFLPDAKESPALIHNKRAKLNTGTNCNYKCSFCYYIDQLHLKKSFEDIKNDIDSIVLAGFTEIELSGGESSIHTNWFDILNYIPKHMKISTVTNGSMFSNEEFIIKSNFMGLTDILFSVHNLEDKHDEIVQSKNAFCKIKKAIKNAQQLQMEVRINCTVNELFLDDMINYSKFIIDTMPDQINILPVNSWSDANEHINYLETSIAIKSFIDIIKKYDIKINVRYIPLCFMRGYEQYCYGTYQQIFDDSDWNISTFNGVPKSIPSKEELFDIAKNNRLVTYVKKAECFKCSDLYICDGVEFNNVDAVLVPKDDIKYKNVLHYKVNS